MNKQDIERVLISEQELDEIAKRLGAQISADYEGKELLLVCVLKGSVNFMSDLMRNITCDCKIDFISVSSYQGAQTTGVLTYKKDLDCDPEGKDILIVEDIIDSGVTLYNLRAHFEARNAASVKICTCLDKPENRKIDISADYVGVEVPNEFVVGYGLDYNEAYRNLPFVGILSEKVYSGK